MRQGHAAWQGGSDWPLFERSTTLTMRPQVDACESRHCSRLHHLDEGLGIAHINVFNNIVEPPSRPLALPSERPAKAPPPAPTRRTRQTERVPWHSASTGTLSENVGLCVWWCASRR